MTPSTKHVLGFIMAVVATMAVCTAALAVYAFGYEIGAWPGGCRLDHSQPKCVSTGWGRGGK